MIIFFVNRIVTTTIFVGFLVLLGAVAISELDIEESPQIEFPIVNITTTYSGATPEDLESEVVDKIEDAVSEVSEIKKITSEAREGVAFTTIEFNLEASIDTKFIEVKDKVEAIRSNLPDDADDPIIQKIDPFAKSVVDIALSSQKLSLRELVDLATDSLKPRLSSAQGVAAINLSGGRERQINIMVDPELMKKYYVTIDDVVRTISSENMALPAGNVNTKEYSISIRFSGEFEAVDEIANLPLTTQEGRKIKLSQIAVIDDSFAELETISRFNGEEIVLMSVIKAEDGNAVKIAEQIDRILDKLNAEQAGNVDLKVVSNNTDNIVFQTVDTVKSIILGVLLTVIILFLFTGNLTTTVISSIVVPTTIVATFFMMQQSEFTINSMSLLAIGTALGTLIANAIVIIENVDVKLKAGLSPKEAAIEGTEEVVVPLIGSVGSNLVVFLPIAFMGGIVGKYMIQFGLTVVFATIYSLIISLTLTPMLCGAWMKSREGGKESGLQHLISQVIDKINDYIKVIFDIMFARPLFWLLGTIALIVSYYAVFPLIGNEFTSDYDKDLVSITVTLPTGSRIETTLDRVVRIEEIVKQIPEVKTYTSKIGVSGVEVAVVDLNLSSSLERKKSDVDIIQELIPKLSTIPDVEITLSRSQSSGAMTGDIQFSVYGEDFDQMADYVDQMITIMKQSGYFQQVQTSWKNPKTEMLLKADRDKFIQYGVKSSDLAVNIRSSIYGDNSNVMKIDGDEVPINVQLRESNRFIASVADIGVKSPKGIVPVGLLSDIRLKDSSPTILLGDRIRKIDVYGNLVKSTAEIVRKDITEEFDKIKFAPGNSYRFGGDSENQDETIGEISKAFLLAAIFILMLLAALLNSWIHPITICLSILNAYSGVFVMLYLFEYTLNISSMLAMVMLIGMVVNNEIIVIDEINRNLERGLELKDAIWKALSSKTRVIIMTSLAVVFGTMPQMLSIMSSKGSMGAVIVGGNIASLIFAFTLTPVVFYFMEKMRRKFG